MKLYVVDNGWEVYRVYATRERAEEAARAIREEQGEVPEVACGGRVVVIEVEEGEAFGDV